MEVFTEEWASACCEALNRGGVYAVTAAEWEEGGSVLTMAADPAHGIMEDRAVFVDAHRGHCNGARMASEADIEAASFVFRADAATWKRLLAGEIPEGAFSTNLLWDRAIEAGRLYGVVHEGLWFDIGAPHNIKKAEEILGLG